MKRLLVIAFALFVAQSVFAQKKILDHSDYDIWKNITDENISNDGKWVSYVLESNGEANPILKISNGQKEVFSYVRGNDPVFTYDSKFVVFKIKPDLEEVKDLKRNKTKDEDLPLDSLGIYNLNDNSLTKVPHLKKVKVPEKWSGAIAYTVDNSKVEPTGDENEADDAEKKKKKKKSNGKKDGYTLVIHNTEKDTKEQIQFITDYTLAEESASIAYINSGKDSLVEAGVYHIDPQTFSQTTIYEGKGKYHKLKISRTGKAIAFVADHDTTKVQIRPNEIHLWQKGNGSEAKIIDNASNFLESGWVVSSDHGLDFSEDESRLFLGIAPPPVLEDTTLLEEEIVKVEVWSYTDGKLHTQQKIDSEDDRKKAYLSAYHINDSRLSLLSQLDIPEVEVGDEGNAAYAIGENNQKYLKSRSWEGGPDYRDLYLINVNTGESTLIAEKIRGSAQLSPKANFAYWYDRVDSAWFSYSVNSKNIYQITTNETVDYFNELNDVPNYPSPYGTLSWTENDEKILIYDRYDIWEVDPENKTAPVNLTKTGRDQKIRYRYIKLDDDERFIKKNSKLLLSAFNESDKSETLIEFNYGKGSMKELKSGPYHFDDFKKAKDADNMIYTMQSFEVFPDIRYTDAGFKKDSKISNANPQQSEYNWGTAELYSFISLDGKELNGLLIKPEDFDPNKKYPMIVNFYEKSSDGLHRHRAPSPGRSTISYSFYTSRGYVIFNPDVYYRTGYPGESAYNCVMPGVTSLIEEGFIDKDHIGVQGHSWGGYQIAYLVTQTDIFRAAEAGAPVPNMISAYGGIRWWTGLSRMFQYEHTQSRIGGTLWEYPLRFIENSPIFFVDKINTPVLIMHNDADGHVPWYQGIEFFVAMRRLGKPSWMLNYQEEPHWPLKLQHRRDFNIRLQQYFDHYLKEEPMPKWMKEGRPATEIGIKQGYELVPADQH